MKLEQHAAFLPWSQFTQSDNYGVKLWSHNQLLHLQGLTERSSVTCNELQRTAYWHVLWRQKSERKILKHSLLWIFFKYCLCFWGVWILSWSQKSSLEVLLLFLYEWALLALILGSRNYLPRVYRDAGELHSPEGILWATFFFLFSRTLPYLSFRS